jgi:hypothetical protein
MRNVFIAYVSASLNISQGAMVNASVTLEAWATSHPTTWQDMSLDPVTLNCALSVSNMVSTQNLLLGALMSSPFVWGQPNATTFQIGQEVMGITWDAFNPNPDMSKPWRASSESAPSNCWIPINTTQQDNQLLNASWATRHYVDIVKLTPRIYDSLDKPFFDPFIGTEVFSLWFNSREVTTSNRLSHRKVVTFQSRFPVKEVANETASFNCYSDRVLWDAVSQNDKQILSKVRFEWREIQWTVGAATWLFRLSKETDISVSAKRIPFNGAFITTLSQSSFWTATRSGVTNNLTLTLTFEFTSSPVQFYSRFLTPDTVKGTVSFVSPGLGNVRNGRVRMIGSVASLSLVNSSVADSIQFVNGSKVSWDSALFSGTASDVDFAPLDSAYRQNVTFTMTGNGNQVEWPWDIKYDFARFLPLPSVARMKSYLQGPSVIQYASQPQYDFDIQNRSDVARRVAEYAANRTLTIVKASDSTQLTITSRSPYRVDPYALVITTNVEPLPFWRISLQKTAGLSPVTVWSQAMGLVSVDEVNGTITRDASNSSILSPQAVYLWSNFEVSKQGNTSVFRTTGLLGKTTFTLQFFIQSINVNNSFKSTHDGWGDRNWTTDGVRFALSVNGFQYKYLNSSLALTLAHYVSGAAPSASPANPDLDEVAFLDLAQKGRFQYPIYSTADNRPASLNVSPFFPLASVQTIIPESSSEKATGLTLESNATMPKAIMWEGEFGVDMVNVLVEDVFAILQETINSRGGVKKSAACRVPLSGLVIAFLPVIGLWCNAVLC